MEFAGLRAAVWRTVEYWTSMVSNGKDRQW